MLFVSDRSDGSDGSAGSVMGPKGLLWVCEVDLKIWCRFYPVFRDEIGAFFVGGVG